MLQAMNVAPTASATHLLHIALRDGFRGHTVVIAVDGREVYRRSGVTTDRKRARADAFHVATASAAAHIAVSVTPGERAAFMRFDVSRYPNVAIGLVGKGTVSFEPSGSTVATDRSASRRPSGDAGPGDVEVLQRERW